MKLRTLLIINAVILGGSGISAILLPEKVCSLYGLALTSEVMLMAQYAGLGSVAIALVAWFIRDVEDPHAQRAITRAFVITYVFGLIISVQGTISGIMDLGWPIVILYTLLAAAYGCFLFSKRSAA